MKGKAKEDEKEMGTETLAPSVPVGRVVIIDGFGTYNQ
jgi:hypothetical protein